MKNAATRVETARLDSSVEEVTPVQSGSVAAQSHSMRLRTSTMIPMHRLNQGGFSCTHGFGIFRLQRFPQPCLHLSICLPHTGCG